MKYVSEIYACLKLKYVGTYINSKLLVPTACLALKCKVLQDTSIFFFMNLLSYYILFLFIYTIKTGRVPVAN